MILNGRALASEILTDVRTGLHARTCTVRAVVVQPSPATESYLAIKESRAKEAGMHLEVVRLKQTAHVDDVIEVVRRDGADAVIVQLPLPSNIDTNAVLSQIPVEKDADVLSREAYTLFEKGEAGALVPPVAGAVLEILTRAGVPLPGAKVVVVGEGRLVGKPVAVLLRRLGAVVTVIDKTTEHPEQFLREADIIVSGAGEAHFIKPEMVKEGVVLIDAGTSESGGAIAGDMDPACAEKASLFTPVPGGVGPIAVAFLFKNASTLSC